MIVHDDGVGDAPARCARRTQHVCSRHGVSWLQHVLSPLQPHMHSLFVQQRVSVRSFCTTSAVTRARALDGTMLLSCFLAALR